MTNGVCVLVAIVLFSFVSPVTSGAANHNNNANKESAEQTAIRKVLENQVAAWNRHDLESFMQGYWNSPELTFVSGAKVTRGWQPTLERYRNAINLRGMKWARWNFPTLTFGRSAQRLPLYAASSD